MTMKSLRRLLLGAEKVSDEKTKKNVSWPTAQERVAAAREAQGNGETIMATRSSVSVSPSPQNGGPTMLVCPMVAKELLQQHEDCRRYASSNSHKKDNQDSGDDSDSDSNADDDILAPNPKSTVSSITLMCLHKPVKPNRLLQHALTNANGDNWRRQRPLVQRALGDASIVRHVAVPASVQAALDIVSTISNTKKTTATLEVRSFAEQVAVATMIASVFGTNLQQSHPESYKELTHAISNLFRPTLLPIRGDEARAVALGIPVRRLVNELVTSAAEVSASASPSTNYIDTALTKLANGNPCLAKNLLHKHGEGSSLLSLEEVIGNCHSALLAGTQTISTTLVGCMLHLAEWHPGDIDNESGGMHTIHINSNDQKAQIPTKATFRAIVQEALRILPPVASLPRCPVYGDLDVPTTISRTTNNDISATTCRVPRGGLLVVDVLSMAHATATNGDGKGGKDDTWVFCPFRNKANEPTNTSDDKCINSSNKNTNKVPPCYPWGIGDRICPAGNLSVSCISAILEALVIQEKWSWRLSNPTKDSVGAAGTQGWIQAVSYEPSLTYPSPLYVELVHYMT